MFSKKSSVKVKGYIFGPPFDGVWLESLWLKLGAGHVTTHDHNFYPSKLRVSSRTFKKSLVSHPGPSFKPELYIHYVNNGGISVGSKTSNYNGSMNVY